MDRAMEERHLAEVEAHIALGERHIVRQRKLVAELARDGHDTTEAKRLLANLEETQALYIATRDLARRELVARFL
jgi:hypothetical protein